MNLIFIKILSTIILLFIVVLFLITVINRLTKLLFLCIAKKNLPNNIDRFPTINLEKYPHIVFHMVICNENPEIVCQSLTSLSKIDYPNYVVLVLDNNTIDDNLWKPVKKFCLDNSDRFKFFHVDHIKGYKCGALNYILERTPKEYDFIAIVDADVIVEPSFLREIIPLFSEEKVAIVQTPLGFTSDPREDSFRSWIYLIYRYFLSIYMPAAARFNCAPFIGSMGVLRRSALEKVGAWNGFYLTEDMEITGRLLSHGFLSKYIDYNYGRSIPPGDLRNFKKQHTRWNFGNAQIFRDKLSSFFRISKKNGSPLSRLLIYFACPGIYINVYLLPFAIVAIFIQLSGMLFIDINFTYFTCLIMIVTLCIELLGDIILFVSIWRYERVSLSILLRNLTAWWALSFNNAVSTLAVLYYPTRPFEITAKCSEHEFNKTSPYKFELTFATLCFIFGLGSLLPPLYTLTISSIVLFIVGGLSAIIVILPEKFKGFKLWDTKIVL